jgi:hypothetical protein
VNDSTVDESTEILLDYNRGLVIVSVVGFLLALGVLLLVLLGNQSMLDTLSTSLVDQNTVHGCFWSELLEISEQELFLFRQVLVCLLQNVGVYIGVAFLHSLHIKLLGVSRDRNLEFLWQDLQIEQKFVQINESTVHSLGMGVKHDKIVLDFEHPAQCLLKDGEQSCSLLRVQNLVVNVLQFLVSFNVAEVELSVEIEPFLRFTSGSHFPLSDVLVVGSVLHLVVVQEVVEGLFPLEFVLDVRHIFFV